MSILDKKWIIQEIVKARTVVLRHGQYKCTMEDFERFYRLVRDQRDFDFLGDFENTPAARIVLQRLEINSVGQTAGQLRRLLRRFADSNCEKPCDHVYALYSLIGYHRTELPIDYAATSIRQLADVLFFMHDCESLHPDEAMQHTQLLMKQFRLRPKDILDDPGVAGTLDMTVSVNTLGPARRQRKSLVSTALRKSFSSLWEMPTYHFESVKPDSSAKVPDRRFTRKSATYHTDEYVPTSEMVYFTSADSQIHGLAAASLDSGEVIWHIPGARIAFVVRLGSNHTAKIIGRAFIFAPDEEFTLTLDADISSDLAQACKQNFSLDLHTLVELIDLATVTGGAVGGRAGGIAARSTARETLEACLAAEERRAERVTTARRLRVNLVPDAQEEEWASDVEEISDDKAEYDNLVTNATQEGSLGRAIIRKRADISSKRELIRGREAGGSADTERGTRRLSPIADNGKDGKSVYDLSIKGPCECLDCLLEKSRAQRNSNSSHGTR
jgi:hypothetical protein